MTASANDTPTICIRCRKPIGLKDMIVGGLDRGITHVSCPKAPGPTRQEIVLVLKKHQLQAEFLAATKNVDDVTADPDVVALGIAVDLVERCAKLEALVTDLHGELAAARAAVLQDVPLVPRLDDEPATEEVVR